MDTVEVDGTELTRKAGVPGKFCWPRVMGVHPSGFG